MYSQFQEKIKFESKKPDWLFDTGNKSNMSSHNSHKNIGYTTEPKDDLYQNLRILLIFGRLFGLIPIKGVFSKSLSSLEYKKSNFPAVVTAIIICILAINNCIAAIGLFQSRGRDASEIAKNAAPFACYSIGLFVFVYIYRFAPELISLFHTWRSVTVTFRQEDVKLFRDVNLIGAFVFTSAILENSVSHINLFILQDHMNNNGTKMSQLESYYTKSHGQWNNLIPYNGFIALAVFFCNKVTVYAWNFGDVLISVICRGLYFKFKSLNEEAESHLFNKESPTSDVETWKLVVRDHYKLCKLVEKFDEFLSPLIFSSYAVNVYFICLQLHLGLAPSAPSDFVSALYAAWSFLHLLFRCYIVSLCAAKINEHAYKISNLLYKCPLQLYSNEVERAERRVALSRIGVGGLECFVISFNFLLSVVNTVFTLEVVLLQANAPVVVQPTQQSVVEVTNAS